MTCRAVMLCLLILTFSKPHAQSLLKKPSVAARFFYGTFITRLPKAQYLRDSYSYFGELSLQQQTDGRKAWQLANNLPQVGVALFYGNTGSKHYMGAMAGAFPYVSWKLFKTGALTSSLRAGAGLAWVQKPYDKITNHKSVLIGTHANAYIDFLWEADVRLFSNVHMAAGLNFSHLSNGSSTLPNLGLNIPTLSIGLRYAPPVQPPVAASKRAPVPRRSSILVFTTVGIKQYPWIEGKRYIVNTVQGEWNRHFRPSGMYSGGAVLFYDRAREVNPLGILDQKQRGKYLQAGLFAGYEHLFGRLSVPVQLGAYVYNQGLNTSLFQQIGFRYRINPVWSAQLAMKTHSGKADFIHAGIGYRIR